MSKTKYLIAVICCILIAVVICYLFWGKTKAPTISIENDTTYISPNRPLTVTITSSHSPIQYVTVTAKQNEQITIITHQPFINGHLIETIPVSFEHSGLIDGKLELTIKTCDTSFANFGKGNISTQVWEMVFDSKPPQIHIYSPIPYIHRGSATVIAYTVSKPVVSTGVQIGKNVFPAFQQPDGNFYCFFPFPLEDSLETFKPKMYAQDLSGNNVEIHVPIYPLNKNLKNDTLNISDSFLEKKMPAFEQVIPDTPTQLDRYIKVNNVLRVDNEKTLIEIGKKTSPTMLWSGKFYSLPRSAVKATFGDLRNYMYKNTIIDQQVHMGLDLASIANAPVPAANDGVVIYTGELGIFGNLIIIDHGLGLQTLYSHLSSIVVNENDIIKKGDTIGYTGTTGLAGGDHLHFGVLVGGIQVNPVDWLDPKWIQHTITARLHPPDHSSKSIPKTNK